MKAEEVKMTEQMEGKNAVATVPITSDTIEPIVQQEINEHMKTINLPSAIISHFRARKRKLNRESQADAAGLFTRVIRRAKRAIRLLALFPEILMEFNRQDISQSISIF